MRVYDAGSEAAEVTVADLDQDGDFDMVLAGGHAGTVSVLKNDGDGIFSISNLPATLSISYVDEKQARRQGLGNTNGIAVFDINADERLDIIVSDESRRAVAVLFGTSTGGYAAPLTTYLSFAPANVTASNLNENTIPDFVLMNADNGDLVIYLDVTDGLQLGEPSHVIEAGGFSAGIRPHDLNDDTNTDFLVGNEYGDILVLLGNGDGSLQNYQRIGQNVNLGVFDINNDGREDLLVSNETLDRVSVQLATAENQFTTTFEKTRDDELLAPGSVQFADINQDGLVDILVANTGGNNLLVYLGHDSPDGSTEFHRMSFFAGTNPSDFALSDMNADGVLDVAVTNAGSNDVSILFGSTGPDGWRLIPGPRLELSTIDAESAQTIQGLAPVDIVIEDATEDGLADLLVTNRDSNNAFLLPGVGDGFFDDTNPTVFATGNSPTSSLLLPLDNVPGLDLVSFGPGSNQLAYYSSMNPRLRQDIETGGNSPIAAVSGDLDGNGTLELLVAHNEDGIVSLISVSGGGGLIIEHSFQDDSISHPSAMALARLGERQELSLLITNEGDEVVRIFNSEQFLPSTTSRADIFVQSIINATTIALRDTSQLISPNVLGNVTRIFATSFPTSVLAFGSASEPQDSWIRAAIARIVKLFSQDTSTERSLDTSEWSSEITKQWFKLLGKSVFAGLPIDVVIGALRQWAFDASSSYLRDIDDVIPSFYVTRIPPQSESHPVDRLEAGDVEDNSDTQPTGNASNVGMETNEAHAEDRSDDGSDKCKTPNPTNSDEKQGESQPEGHASLGFGLFLLSSNTRQYRRNAKKCLLV